MSPYESTIAARLHAAAGRIPVDVDPTFVAGPHSPTVVRRRPSRPLLVAGAAAVVAAALTAVAAVGFRSGAPTVEVGPGSPAGVGPPPAWFGEPHAAFREAGRSGRWVSTAIGRVSDDGVSDPIVASVFDGTYAALDDAVPIEVDGVPLRSARFGDSLVLATVGSPTVVVSGPDDERTLAAVLRAVDVLDPSGEFSLRLRSRPEGYTEIAAPQVLRPATAAGETLASESGDTAIDEVADGAEPLLAAAGSGADLAAVDVHGTTGWFGRTTTEAAGTLTFLVWSPRPGAVLQVTTQDSERTEDDLVELARWASTIDPVDWDALHRD